MAIIRYLHLGLTAACNLNCKHCFIKEKESKELSFEKAIAFIDVLEKQGLTHYLLYLMANRFFIIDYLNFPRISGSRGFIKF